MPDAPPTAITNSAEVSPTPPPSAPLPPPGPRNGRPREVLGKGRIEAFSDGVLAIAITLLVLDLHIPTGLSHAAFHQALLQIGPRLYAFTLSFCIVGVYWVAHHLMFTAIRHADRTLLWLNNLFLLFVSAIPFSAAVLGAYPDERIAVILYGANLAAASSALQILWNYATRGRRLISPEAPDHLLRAGTVRTGVAIAVYLLAIALSFVSLTVSRAIYWFMPLSFIVLQGLLDTFFRRGAKKDPGAHGANQGM